MVTPVMPHAHAVSCGVGVEDLARHERTRAPARSPARKLPLERKKDAGKTSKSTEADSCNKSSLG